MSIDEERTHLLGGQLLLRRLLQRFDALEAHSHVGPYLECATQQLLGLLNEMLQSQRIQKKKKKKKKKKKERKKRKKERNEKRNENT
jgi:hypothetical protein